jgi:ribosome biogenesis GTPase
LDTTSNQNHNTGVVYRKTIGGYSVHLNGRVVECALSSKLRLQFEDAKPEPGSRKRETRKARRKERADPVVVGDQVQFIDAQDGSGMIVEILPRRSQLARRSAVPMPTARPYEQVIAANVDQVVPVFAAARPKPKWHLLDRYLVSAEAAGLPALICVTKIDLAQDRSQRIDQALLESLQIYRDIGYPLVLTSALTGEGVNQFKQALQGRTSVFLGKSGVGKTSFLNALQPDLGLRVKEVSQVTGKGKHTTTHLEMFPLEFGGAIIDTPGMREFGLWDVDERDLAFFFPEMRPYLGHCKFGLDCRHDEEPGCEIRQAVSVGEISPYRYRSYMRLMVESR